MGLCWIEFGWDNSHSSTEQPGDQLHKNNTVGFDGWVGEGGVGGCPDHLKLKTGFRLKFGRGAIGHGLWILSLISWTVGYFHFGSVKSILIRTQFITYQPYCNPLYKCKRDDMGGEIILLIIICVHGLLFPLILAGHCQHLYSVYFSYSHNIAKLSPSPSSSSAELAVFAFSPTNPTTHQPPNPRKIRNWLQLATK